jgi:hypothetical protein
MDRPQFWTFSGCVCRTFRSFAVILASVEDIDVEREQDEEAKEMSLNSLLIHVYTGNSICRFKKNEMLFFNVIEHHF